MQSVPNTAERQSDSVSAQSKTPHDLACAALLDASFYINQYPDIAAAGVDPLEHYTLYGHSEGRLPRSIHSPDSDRAAQEALKHDPANKMAIELHIAIEIKHADAKMLLDAAELYRATFQTAPPVNDLLSGFENAATDILGEFLQFRNMDSIAVIASATAILASIFPQSVKILALHALAMFESGNLAAAEIALSKVTHAEGLPSDTVRLLGRATNQIAEADSINSDRQAGQPLMLLDSAFPSKVSSFRYGEFSTYLQRIENSEIQIRPDFNLFRFGELDNLADQINRFSLETRVSPLRLKRFDSTKLGTPRVAYCVFLNLADLFFTQIGIPSAAHLAFTLYPGGGFAPDDIRSDTALRRLCDNPRLSKIITTQNVSYRYLIDHGLCDPSRILHVFGGIIPSLYDDRGLSKPERTTHGALNVCFVAQRYSAIGAEKGYDVFAQVIADFANSTEIEFHVVGGFDETVIDLAGAKNVTFYGTQPASFFPDFYDQMDVFLSPNIQMSVLDPSQPTYFDGFPTTAVVEAGLRGVAMLLTDFQGMNRHLDGAKIFSDDEVQIINRDHTSISELLGRYMRDRDALRKLGQKGRAAILREFSFERQMQPRMELLNTLLAS